ncbi:hypothetical protein PHLGIDRAFT_226576 [Phlebiopsis gigantea 11061_1 CR5-6]|uniref:Uncharacterized protein n=1 Tax=Phlebiopsis gigantea (strain 11061_1 CR5-6) TaxID=745531 RepID=A0A0C3PE97_PHLG1|nr:hypothetical protein PHLGIDRAFT_226576 [Phlebiopsis gigantea 11061_1 CR5-6]
MSECDLPEELVCDILAICLTIPPEDFFRVQKSTQERKGLSTPKSSDLLVVSRRWCRIGAPLLYSSLIISNNVTAEAIIAYLRGFPDVGHATRSIRVEAGVEGRLHDIARLTPRVQRLYIAFDHMSNHAAQALTEALPLWCPTELFLVDMTRFLRLYPFFPYRASMRPDSATRAVGNVIVSHWHDLRRAHLGPDSSAALSSAAALSGSCLSLLVTETSPKYALLLPALLVISISPISQVP